MEPEWEPIKRDQYLLMLDRHRALWAALHEFVYANKVGSLIEAGCGVADLSWHVNDYVGIDMNKEVLKDNEIFYTKQSTWIDGAWLDIDVSTLPADMFLAASLVEHCEAFEPFLGHILDIPELKYAIVTFHKGLRGSFKERKQSWKHHGKSGEWFNNYYARTDVERWLTENVATRWRIFDIEHSRSERWRSERWDSVLVIDWTEEANLEMWEKLDGAR